MDIEGARRLLRGIEDAKRAALQDRRATARWWNGDDWGSISGIKDAEAWVESQVLNYILRTVNEGR